MEIDVDERRRRLAVRHLLTPTTRVASVDVVVDALVALHSSDPVTVYLSAALRMREPTIEAVDRALYDERRLLRHHAMRRTLWAMSPPTARAAHSGFTRKIAAAERRRTMKLFDLDEAEVDEAVERVSAVVHDHGGPISTRAVGERPDLAVPVPVAQARTTPGRWQPTRGRCSWLRSRGGSPAADRPGRGSGRSTSGGRSARPTTTSTAT
ncbi:MAG: crosslink repair DNA glycosylase YcaQ family protein [Ilumatobacteraceae bacterium]